MARISGTINVCYRKKHCCKHTRIGTKSCKLAQEIYSYAQKSTLKPLRNSREFSSISVVSITRRRLYTATDYQSMSICELVLHWLLNIVQLAYPVALWSARSVESSFPFLSLRSSQSFHALHAPKSRRSRKSNWARNTLKHITNSTAAARFHWVWHKIIYIMVLLRNSHRHHHDNHYREILEKCLTKIVCSVGNLIFFSRSKPHHCSLSAWDS